jgi:hypothetical protein
MWYPKNIAIGLVLLALFAVAMNLAVDVKRGIAMGLLAAVAYAVVDVILSVNPGVWRLPRR